MSQKTDWLRSAISITDLDFAINSQDIQKLLSKYKHESRLMQMYIMGPSIFLNVRPDIKITFAKLRPPWLLLLAQFYRTNQNQCKL